VAYPSSIPRHFEAYHKDTKRTFNWKAGRYLAGDIPEWVHRLPPIMKRKYIEIESLTHMQLLLVCFDSKIKISVPKVNKTMLHSLRSRAFNLLQLEHDNLTPQTIFRINAEDGDYFAVKRENTRIAEECKEQIIQFGAHYWTEEMEHALVTKRQAEQDEEQWLLPALDAAQHEAKYILGLEQTPETFVMPENPHQRLKEL
jgi:hypothetical protein